MVQVYGSQVKLMVQDLSMMLIRWEEIYNWRGLKK